MTMTTVNCHNCLSKYQLPDDADGLLPDLYPVEYYQGRPPTVEHCTFCADEDVSQCEVLLEDDGRGFTLYYGPRYDEDTRTLVVCYSAGCRRFTYYEAIQHWGGGVYHPDRDAANRLFLAVVNHAALEIGTEIGLGG